MDIREPAIRKEDILALSDPAFSPEHVCVVTGASSGIGRATAVAAAVNGLTVAALDINAEGGEKTRRMAETLGGQVHFFHVDLTDDAAVAAKQAFETKQIKQIFHGAEGKADMAGAVARTEAERPPLAMAIQAAFLPVTHTIAITAE